jgi:transposase, IS5 family
MGRQAGFFDLEERLAGLSAKGDGLERLSAVVDFELFRPELERAVPRADRSQGGRPPFDHVLMFKVLVLQTQNNLSDERTEFYLRDRLTRRCQQTAALAGMDRAPAALDGCASSVWAWAIRYRMP